MGDLLKAMAANQKAPTALGHQTDQTWETECQRDVRYVEAMEGGTTWQPNAPRRDPQQELSKAESLLANPPWQRLRKKRSSSADDASPDTGDVTPRSGATTPRAATTPRSAVETARRSLTPPPSFSPTERRPSTLTRSWEKVASP